MQYDELVKRLRHSANFAERGLIPPPSELREAADAIEELQQIAAHYEETSKEYFKDACYYRERVPHWIPATGLPTSPCETCAHKGNVDFDYCHICNNEADMYKPKEET